MEAEDVVLVCRVREAWDVGERHFTCCCTGACRREAPRKPVENRRIPSTCHLSSLLYGNDNMAATPFRLKYLETRKAY